MRVSVVEVHQDIHVQPPLHRSGVNDWNNVMVGELSTVIVGGIPNVAIPNDQSTVR